MERAYKIAKELSDIIIYCRSISFNIERAKKAFVFYEMSSFPETKAEKLMCQLERNFFLKYHQVRFFSIPNWITKFDWAIFLDSNIENLSERFENRLVKLQSDQYVELWLSNGRFELPDWRQTDATQSGQVSRQRSLRLLTETGIYVQVSSENRRKVRIKV